jgi:hypothetical protein
MKNVEKIMEGYLLAFGYDGLYHDTDCGCKIGDLGPCGHLCLDCKPGYLTETPGGEYDWIIGPGKMGGE